MSEFYVGDDGCLYRGDRLIRRNYKRHHRTIGTVADLKAVLRAGDHCWPDGYPLYFITDDGASLCPGCVREEFHSVIDSIKNRSRDGWLVVAVDVAHGEDEYCDHCGNDIE